MMRPRDLINHSSALIPLIARAIELDRGPAALVEWLATQPAEAGFPLALALLLAENLQFEHRMGETTANTSLCTTLSLDSCPFNGEWP